MQSFTNRHQIYQHNKHHQNSNQYKKTAARSRWSSCRRSPRSPPSCTERCGRTSACPSPSPASCTSPTRRSWRSSRFRRTTTSSSRCPTSCRREKSKLSGTISSTRKNDTFVLLCMFFFVRLLKIRCINTV